MACDGGLYLRNCLKRPIGKQQQTDFSSKLAFGINCPMHLKERRTIFILLLVLNIKAVLETGFREIRAEAYAEDMREREWQGKVPTEFDIKISM